jgi:tetratricopeptide (TPR) repeat protein
MSATFLKIAKEGQADLDSCMYAASRSFGISRYAMLAEGIEAPGLQQQSQWVDHHDPATGRHLLSPAKGIHHLQLLILLGAYYAYEPHAYYRYRDSVTYFITEAMRESKTLHAEHLGRQALCILAKIYMQANDPTADSIANEVLDLSRRTGDVAAEARINAYRGIYTQTSGNTIQDKIRYLQQASAAYLFLGNKENVISVITYLGYLQIFMQDLDGAYKNFLEALQLAESIHYPYTHYNTQALTTVTLFQGKFGEPLKYSYQTIRTAEVTRDSIAWAYFYTSLSLLYSAEGRNKESFELAQKSVTRFVADRNTSVYGILNDVVEYMIQEGQAKKALQLVADITRKVGMPVTYGDQFFYHYVLSNCYMSLDSLDQAEIQIKELDTIETNAAAIRGPARRSAVIAQYAYLLTKRRQYHQARELFEQNLAAPSFTDGNILSKLGIYQQVIYIDSILGDDHSSIAH